MNLIGIDLNGTDLWLLAIAGTAGTWLVLHKLSVERDKRSRYAAACGKFRTEVLAALMGLYPSPVEWPEDKIAIINVLKTRLPMLQATVAEFRPHVSFWERWLFDIAWRRYLNGERWAYGTRQDYWQYVPHTGEGISDGKRYSHDNRLTYQQDFKQNVARLLSYAKET